VDCFIDVPGMDGLVVNRCGVFMNKYTGNILNGSSSVDKETGRVYHRVSLRTGRPRALKEIMKSRALGLVFIPIPEEYANVSLGCLNMQFKDKNTSNLSIDNLYWSLSGQRYC
jgi:hypothetical protein